MPYLFIYLYFCMVVDYIHHQSKSCGPSYLYIYILSLNRTRVYRSTRESTSATTTTTKGRKEGRKKNISCYK